MKISTKWIIHAPARSCQHHSLWIGAPCVAPCQRVLTLRIHPLGVQVGQGGLVAQLLEGLGRFLVDKTTATPPPGLLCLERHGVGGRGGAIGAQSVGPRVASEAQARGAIEEYGRQLGGGREEWIDGRRGRSRMRK